MPPTSPPIPLPRALIILASLWLIGAGLLTIGLERPVHFASSSFAYALRMMLLCLAVGVMIGWPLLRLSQRPAPAPLRQAWLDVIVLVAMVQVVIWPLRLVTTWSPLRTVALDATIVGWTILAGVIVAAGSGAARGGARTFAMIAAIALCLAGPTVAWVGARAGVDTGAWFELSPLVQVHRIAAAGGAPVPRERWLELVMLGTTAAAAWLALAGSAMIVRRRAAA